MRTIGAFISMLLLTAAVQAAIKTQEIDYKAGDRNLKGYLAYDDATTGKRPGIIVAPEWWGNNDYSHKRAEMLAGLGYVGFAIDLYGDGKSTTDPKQAGAWAAAIKGDRTLGTALLQAAVDTLKAQPQVDDKKLGAIGYCFGGTAVLNMARLAMPVIGVVSFHGDLSDNYKIGPKAIVSKVLVCHGADDEMVNPAVDGFMKEMKNTNADFQFIAYAHAQHAFTNPGADSFGLKGIKYDALADKRSWQAMKDFFNELFAK